MTTSEIHIGSIIEQRVRSGGHSITWLAGCLCCERTNIYSIFRRDSIDSDLLLRISQALNFDFFAVYSEHLRKITHPAVLIQMPRSEDLEAMRSAAASAEV